MKLRDKIAVMQAALDGKTIQVKNSLDYGPRKRDRFAFHPDWVDMRSPESPGKFNFYLFEYRVRPRDLLELATMHLFEYEAVQAIACTARAIRGRGRECVDRWWNYSRKERFELIYYENGDVQVGCEKITWPDIDALGKEQGWWK